MAWTTQSGKAHAWCGLARSNELGPLQAGYLSMATGDSSQAYLATVVALVLSLLWLVPLSGVGSTWRGFCAIYRMRSEPQCAACGVLSPSTASFSAEKIRGGAPLVRPQALGSGTSRRLRYLVGS